MFLFSPSNIVLKRCEQRTTNPVPSGSLAWIRTFAFGMVPAPNNRDVFWTSRGVRVRQLVVQRVLKNS